MTSAKFLLPYKITFTDSKDSAVDFLRRYYSIYWSALSGFQRFISILYTFTPFWHPPNSQPIIASTQSPKLSTPNLNELWVKLCIWSTLGQNSICGTRSQVICSKNTVVRQAQHSHFEGGKKWKEERSHQSQAVSKSNWENSIRFQGLGNNLWLKDPHGSTVWAKALLLRVITLLSWREEHFVAD